MQRRLVELIVAYQAKVQEAMALFRKHQAIAEPMFWRQAGLPQVGFLDPDQTIRYRFHGIGCCVDLPTGPVDWDFGHDGRTDGFDAWRLWRFALEGSDAFPEFQQKQMLEAAFDHAVESGTVWQPYRGQQDDLYYLRDSTQGGGAAA